MRFQRASDYCYQMFRLGICVVLAVAGLLKVAMTFERLSQGEFSLYPDGGTALLGIGECIAAVAIAAGVTGRLFFLGLLGFFVSALIYLSFQGMMGVSQCGCFGNVQVPIAIPIGIDVLAIAGLIYFRSDFIRKKDESHVAPWANPVVAGTAVGILSAFLLVALVLGSGQSLPDAFGAIQRNQVVLSDAVITRVYDPYSRDTSPTIVGVTNYSDRTVKLLGFDAVGCFNTQLEGIPVVVQPGETREIRVVSLYSEATPEQMLQDVMYYRQVLDSGLREPLNPDEPFLSGSMIIYTDQRAQPHLVLTVRVHPAASFVELLHGDVVADVEVKQR